MKLERTADGGTDRGRAPHGARGLKRITLKVENRYTKSRPARGAWIETVSVSDGVHWSSRRAPHGARGLKPTYGLKPVFLQPVAPRTGRVD